MTPKQEFPDVVQIKDLSNVGCLYLTRLQIQSCLSKPNFKILGFWYLIKLCYFNPKKQKYNFSTNPMFPTFLIPQSELV